jgi:hypothetical protein
MANFFAKSLNLFYGVTALGHGNPERMQSAETAEYYTMRPCSA